MLFRSVTWRRVLANWLTMAQEVFLEVINQVNSLVEEFLVLILKQKKLLKINSYLQYTKIQNVQNLLKRLNLIQKMEQLYLKNYDMEHITLKK